MHPGLEPPQLAEHLGELLAPIQEALCDADAGVRAAAGGVFGVMFKSGGGGMADSGERRRMPRPRSVRWARARSAPKRLASCCFCHGEKLNLRSFPPQSSPLCSTAWTATSTSSRAWRACASSCRSARSCWQASLLEHATAGSIGVEPQGRRHGRVLRLAGARVARLDSRSAHAKRCYALSSPCCVAHSGSSALLADRLAPILWAAAMLPKMLKPPVGASTLRALGALCEAVSRHMVPLSRSSRCALDPGNCTCPTAALAALVHA